MMVYDIFFFVFSVIYLPYLVIKGKAHRDFAQRFGKLPSVFKTISTLHPVWIHAVSVGEVMAVKNFVEKINMKFPSRKIILSTTTRTGNEMAKKIFPEGILKFYFPLDFSFVVRRVVNLINPSLFIMMETEIWPNLILELSKRNIPIMLINGRISERSVKGYKKIKFFFKDILGKISVFCMRTQRDARNIESLGAPKERVKITGNMKFDVASDIKTAAVNTALGIDQHDKLIIAGSTHGGEEEIALDVYEELSQKCEHARLLIAPRHIDKAGAIKKIVEQRGFEGALLSHIKGNPNKAIPKKSILILDTFGELGKLYSLATIVFMGGSLVRRGGHNIVEPAAFGKPIVFGPYMFNFRDMAKSFLENKAAVEVKDKKELLETLERLLKDESKRATLGRNAKGLIDKNKGATERNINELTEFIEGKV